MREHYITAIGVGDGVAVLACRCGWITRTSSPVDAWEEHEYEERVAR